MFNGQFAAWRGGPQGGPDSGHGGGIGGGPGGGYFGHTGGADSGVAQQWSAARKVDGGGYHQGQHQFDGVAQHQFHGGPHPANGPRPVNGPRHGPDHGHYPANDGHHVPRHLDAGTPPQGDHGLGQPHLGAAKVGYYGSTHAPQDAPTFHHVDSGPYWH